MTREVIFSLPSDSSHCTHAMTGEGGWFYIPGLRMTINLAMVEYTYSHLTSNPVRRLVYCGNKCDRSETQLMLHKNLLIVSR